MNRAAEPGADQRPPNGGGLFALSGEASRFVTIITIYLLAQLVLRCFYASSVGLDEAEILITAQTADWGHGSQPPLYNWLQIAAFGLFGVNLFALAAVKALLFAIIFGASFMAARMLLKDDRKASIATLSLFLLPQIAWEAQRALTHSVMAVALSALTLLAMLRVLQRGRSLDYAVLGLCIGLGAMSKYNYLIAIGAILAATVSVADLRRRLLTTRALIAVAIAVAIVLPHGLWMTGHLENVLSRTGKFKADTDLALSLKPLLVLLWAAIQSAALPVLVYGVCAVFGRSGSSDQTGDPVRLSMRRMVLRLIPAGLVLVGIGVVAAGVGDLRERWLITLTFLAPLALFILLERRLGVRSLSILKGASLTCAVISLIGLCLIHLAPDLVRDEPPEPNKPVGVIASGVRDMNVNPGIIIIEDTRLAGAFKLEFPEARVIEAQYRTALAGASGPVLLVWGGGDAALPAGLAGLYRDICKAEVGAIEPKPMNARYEHSSVMWGANIAIVPTCPG